MKRVIIIFFLLISQVFSGNAQNVGIGTSTPLARLHVVDSAVLFSSPIPTFAPPYGNPPIQGTGIRMMWYPAKAAFRAGVTVNEWDRDSIGLYSVSFGYRTKAKGSASASMGLATYATGYSSTSMGYETLASGGSSTSMGTGTIATGFASTSMGDATRAYGDQSTSMGSGTFATGDFSTSTGVSTVASGFASASFGLRTFAKSRGGIAMGSYNNIDDNPDPIIADPEDRIFQIGNGISGSSSNAVTILRNGNFGIGMTNPGFTLDVASRMRLRSTPGFTAGTWYNDETNSTIPVFFGMKSSTEIGFYGQTGTNGWRFYVNTGNGNAFLQGVLTQSSDARLKTNIVPLSKTLNAIQEINGYTYHWKDESNPDQQIGLLAQELQKVYPQLVNENANGELSVNYIGMVPVLLEAIKELQKKVAVLEKKLQ